MNKYMPISLIMNWRCLKKDFCLHNNLQHFLFHIRGLVRGIGQWIFEIKK